MNTAQPELQVASRDRYGLDVATAEVLAFGLENVAVQMHRALMRSAFSMVARDTADCAASIIMKTEYGWETIAHAGIAVHGVCSGHTANFVLDEYGEENLRQGDVIFQNDPWRGAVHQSDVSCIRGVFIDGELRFILECCSHLVDTGGPVAGGYPIGARSTFEESLRIAPQLLFAEDIPVRGLFNFILESTRVPQMNLGDLRANYGALVVGERLLQELCERKGTEEVRSAALYALDTAEANMRAAIARIPDGDYTATDLIDDDGINAQPLRVEATVRVRRDRIEVDYSGTERQCEGNCTTAWIDSTRGLIVVKMMLDPKTTYNGGALRPFESVLPVGSLVLGLPPTSVSDHGTIGVRAMNVVMQAMNKAVAEEDTIACDAGNPMFLGLQGWDTRPNHPHVPFGTFVLPGCPWGGTAQGDGLGFSTVQMAGGGIRASVYEHVEREAPVIFWDHEYMVDSAGAGKHRGGVGAFVTVEALAPVEISCVADRIRSGAPGHGGAGRSSTIFAMIVGKQADGVTPARHWNGVTAVDDIVTPVFGMFDELGRPNPYDGELGRGALYDVSKFSGFMLEAGQVLRICTNGGSGWGDPLERDPSAVLRDVVDELVSLEGAFTDYGVVFALEDDGTVLVDESATRARRRGLLDEVGRRETISCFAPWPVTREDLDKLQRPLNVRIDEFNAQSA